MSLTVSGTAGAVVTSAGERGVAIDALHTPGSRRVFAVDQHICISVCRGDAFRVRRHLAIPCDVE